MSKRTEDLAFKYNINTTDDELSLFVSEVYDDGFHDGKAAQQVFNTKHPNFICLGLFMNNQQKIKELQDQIDALKAEAQVAESFDWENSPVICELNGHRWLLGPEADEELTWADAVMWCKAVGGELPPRDILLQAYLNEDIKPLIIDGWYWSGTEFCATTAWVQNFNNGNQFNFTKAGDGCVRAVKRVKV